MPEEFDPLSTTMRILCMDKEDLTESEKKATGGTIYVISDVCVRGCASFQVLYLITRTF